MAIKTPFVGSGEFVPVRVWSCSKHDEPARTTHDCDCQFCSVEPEAWLCGECSQAGWVDKIGPDGKVEMRELGVWEKMLFDLPPPAPDLVPGSTNVTFHWLEDDL